MTSAYMKVTKLRITKCHAPCPNCKMVNDFVMFESGSGGDFETFIGDTTGSIYRLDMHKIHYMRFDESDLLAPALLRENGKIRKIPDEVNCNICKSINKPSPIVFDGDMEVDAIEL